MTIRYGSHPSPFGDCLLLVTDRGICGLAFTDENEPPPDALAYLSQGWENARIVEAADETRAYADRMFAAESSGPRAPNRRRCACCCVAPNSRRGCGAPC